MATKMQSIQKDKDLVGSARKILRTALDENTPIQNIKSQSRINNGNGLLKPSTPKAMFNEIDESTPSKLPSNNKYVIGSTGKELLKSGLKVSGSLRKTPAISSTPPPPPPLDDDYRRVSFVGRDEEEEKVDQYANYQVFASSGLRKQRKTPQFNIGNAYINQAIGNKNPFDGRKLEYLSPDQIAVLVENSLFSHQSIRDGYRFIPHLNKNNVVIVGTSLRSGAASFAKLIDLLIQPGFVDEKALPERVPWIESIANESNPLVERLGEVMYRSKAFLTNFSCRVLESQGFLRRKHGEQAKHIVVVRHPLDIHLSYYRFLRRLYRKAKGGANTKIASFDDFFVADDFIRVDVSPVSAHHAAKLDVHEENSFEKNLQNWMFLHNQFKDKIMFVFYEDLVYNLQLVLTEIASFIGVELTPEKKKVILERFAVDDPHFPIGSKIVHSGGKEIKRKSGSMNKGHLKLCQYSVAYSNAHWVRIMMENFHNLKDFESFYSKCRMAPFPLPPRVLRTLDHFPGQDAEQSRKSLLAMKRQSARMSDVDKENVNTRNEGGRASELRSIELQKQNHTKTSSTLNGFDLFLGNTKGLVIEVATLYPKSYTARKEVPSLGIQLNSTKPREKSVDFFETGAKQRSNSQRFSLLQTLGFSSRGFSGLGKRKDSTKELRESSFSIGTNPFDLVDSDDSDDNYEKEEIQDILYGNSSDT